VRRDHPLGPRTDPPEPPARLAGAGPAGRAVQQPQDLPPAGRGQGRRDGAGALRAGWGRSHGPQTVAKNPGNWDWLRAPLPGSLRWTPAGKRLATGPSRQPAKEERTLMAVSPPRIVSFACALLAAAPLGAAAQTAPREAARVEFFEKKI